MFLFRVTFEAELTDFSLFESHLVTADIKEKIPLVAANTIKVTLRRHL